MSTSFDGLARAAIEGGSPALKVEFPVSSYSIRGGRRKHTHEFPKSPGGKREDLGRKNYEIRMTIMLLAKWRSYDIPLWPDAEQLLRTMFEKGKKMTLTVPTVGDIDVAVNDYEFQVKSSILNGSILEVTFEEDRDGEFLVSEIIQVNAAALGPALDTLLLEADLLELLDAFTELQNLVTSVLALKDTAELYSNALAAKAEGLTNMCNALSEGLYELQQPENIALIDSLHDLWAAAVDLHENALQSAFPMVEYTTPNVMHVADVARALYGDSSQATAILKLNPIDDALAIPSGTVLKCFAPEALAA